MIQSLLESEEGKNLHDNWVPDSTFWLVNESNKIIGVVNIRHRLTDNLFTISVFSSLDEQIAI